MNTPTLFDYAAARQERDDGVDCVTHHCQGFVATVRQRAIEIARERGQVTADDLRAWANDNGLVPHHPNAWGAVFSGKMFTCIGTIQSAYVRDRLFAVLEKSDSAFYA
jgi:hypothetical protein